jgi:outer membrane protein OmpA-like peptidoglycan-associated protein
MTYYLGSEGKKPGLEEAPPPPAPGAAPPPPPPPPPVCNKGPFIVFFEWDSAAITGDASAVLDSAVQAYGSCGAVPVMLAGYADRSGPARYNLGLSKRRDAAVQSYLVGHGIPASAISSQAFGEANPRVPTPDGVRELQNRRVEITYGPGSGH